MHRLVFTLAIFAATSAGMPVASADPIFVDQGPHWTAQARADFYVTDQGSRLISLSWLQALKGRDGRPFLADSMSRYGFLPNPDGSAGLPIGFHTSGSGGAQLVGITCSACHTRQLEVAGKAYRIDGGPSLTDFQAFLGDLDKAAGDVIANEASFATFAASVLHSPTPAPADVAALRRQLEAWYLRYHAWASATLPRNGWGLGRLDAIGIIFNRIAGTDVGRSQDMLIPENMKPGDAPVRYPFLWNAPMQFLTDWGGFVLNGNGPFAMARNTGQALSFGNFEPKHLSGSSFSYGNSINFDGLKKLEGLLGSMGRPIWPKEWPLDQELAKKGKVIYEAKCSTGCHGVASSLSFSEPASWISLGSWATPVQNVGTDTHQFDELGRKVKTGTMEGAGFPPFARRLEAEDYAVHMMFSSVMGTLLAYEFGWGAGVSTGDGFGTLPPNGQSASLNLASLNPAAGNGANSPSPTPPAGTPDCLTIESGTLLMRTLCRGAYEARVLEGIWAAAPYLHNGSVPTLAELLKPPAQRVTTFSLGPKYDVEKIGLAATQGPSSPTRTATGCDNLNSGESNCGHDFGTSLSEEDKKALLEYLKTL